MIIFKPYFFVFLGLVLATHTTMAQQRPDVSSPERPNIVWITTEDMSPRLGCYGDPVAQTPNIDQLARQSVRYTQVYSVSGVCSPSRSALITGNYPSTIGTLHHRTTQKENPHASPYVAVPPPEVKAFPEYLRAAGYYCSNNVKTDYQFGLPFSIWDESSAQAHWRNRPSKDQPFFAVFNSTLTHESGLFRPKFDNKNTESAPSRITDRQAVVLPPYFPDHPEVREDVARQYDNIYRMDAWVGDILAQLAEDGLAENTIVFFFSDHGTCLPRGKRWLYDSGIKVPLLVRWPRHLNAASIDERMISFIDFAPTVLAWPG
ncbi:MAG: sulfatase [Bacteroidia bacterium]|nr:sulfatase [Bacteroidia bacterium]